MPRTLSAIGLFLSLVLSLAVAHARGDEPAGAKESAAKSTPPEFRWSGSFASAAKAASGANKLVLVVYFAGPLREIESALGLSDATTRAKYARHCEASFLQSVWSATSETGGPPRLSGSPLTAFLCTPNGQVLHFWVGHVDVRYARAKIAWAVALERRLATDKREARSNVRQAHLRELAPQVQNIFTKKAGSSWRDNKRLFEPADIDLAKYCKHAHATRAEVLKRIYGRSYLPQQWPRILASLMEHGDVEPDIGHLVLSELPLEPYTRIGGAVFEATTGRPFQPFSPRLQKVASDIDDCRREGKPVLFAVTSKDSNSFASSANIPKHPLVTSLLSAFHVIRLERSDLVVVMDACGLKPPVGEALRLTRFVILDRAGVQDTAFTKPPNGAELANAMRRALRKVETEEPAKRKESAERESEGRKKDDDMGQALGDPAGAELPQETIAKLSDISARASRAAAGYYGVQRNPVYMQVATQANAKLPQVVAATYREFRTPPLWGLRDSAPYMHDGRAKTITEAIALHGGEGLYSSTNFFELPVEQRCSLVEFLQTLAAPKPGK